MNNPDYEQFDERVDLFLRRQMSPEDEKSFREELADNEELRHRARTIALMAREMGTMQQERDNKISETIKGMSEQEFRRVAGIKAKTVGMHSWIVKLAVAACVIGVLFLGTNRYMIYQRTTSLGNVAYSTYTLDLAEDGGSRGIDNKQVIQKLEVLFANVKEGKDLKHTIEDLKLCYEKATKTAGSASIEGENGYESYIDDISWNLAIAYLKDGNREKPVPILMEMLSRNKDYPEIAKPVQDLLKEIENL